MSEPQPPTPSGGPPERKGLSTGAIVALVIVAIIMLLFGTCVAMIFSSGI